MWPKWSKCHNHFAVAFYAFYVWRWCLVHHSWQQKWCKGHPESCEHTSQDWRLASCKKKKKEKKCSFPLERPQSFLKHPKTSLEFIHSFILPLLILDTTGPPLLSFSCCLYFFKKLRMSHYMKTYVNKCILTSGSCGVCNFDSFWINWQCDYSISYAISKGFSQVFCSRTRDFVEFKSSIYVNGAFPERN